MKKLMLVLSLAYLQAPIFSAQEADPIFQLQEQDITAEHFEQQLRYPVGRSETEENILFLGVMNIYDMNTYEIRALLKKATGAVRIDDIITTDNGCDTRYERGEIICVENPCTTRIQPSFYNRWALQTYTTLKALYEKQQADAGEQGGEQTEERQQEENKEDQEVHV
jgi:hypothetical protein